jgi:hypothetical protein
VAVFPTVVLVPADFPTVAVELPARVGVALAPVFAAVRVVPSGAVLAGVGLTGAEARALAASLSDVTAVSRALVAVEIAVSALVSVFADEAAWVAAAFSLVEADDTLVAAETTVRGVTAVVRRTVVPAAVLVRPAVIPAAVLRAALFVPLAPPV